MLTNNKIINEVERGKLPFDVMIFWDSAGNTLCKGAIKVNETGGYMQLRKKFMDDKLTLSAAVRYDKQTR